MKKCKLTIDIAMCTFRRESVVDTLESLQQLDIDEEWEVGIIVADNDVYPSAKERVLSVEQTNIPIHYIHAPDSNISVARNACLATSTSQWLAFIDDDELATPGWLRSLVDNAKTSKAKIVLGAVNATYNKNYCTQWMSEGEFYQTRPVFVNGKIVTGYTCNVLIDRKDEPIKSAMFDLKLGKTGGEDTMFFSSLFRKGCLISYEKRAILYEPIIESRASLKWLWARRFRSGQTHAMLLGTKTRTLSGKSIELTKAIFKTVYCHLMLCASFWNSVSWRRWWLRGALHLGVISSLLGKKTLVQYGHAEVK